MNDKKALGKIERELQQAAINLWSILNCPYSPDIINKTQALINEYGQKLSQLHPNKTITKEEIDNDIRERIRKPVQAEYAKQYAKAFEPKQEIIAQKKKQPGN